MSKKSILGRILRAGASLAAIGAATPAMAQEQPEVSEEIVVTATGRTAAIQDVPIAVQAINNETLEQSGVQSLADLTQIAPTLRIGSGQSTTSGTLAAIRGIGTGSDNPGFEGAVGIFIDGVYRPRAGSALSDLPDIERIEILRGPQGTLFGKNTSAGAISVVTADPSGEVGAWGEIEGGNFNLLRSSFGAEMPVGDAFALRFDGALNSRDGYITDVTSGRDINDRNRWSARLQGLFDISPDASFRLIADASESDENCCGAINIQSGTVVGALLAEYFPGSLLSEDQDQQEEREMTLSPNRSYAEQAEERGISGELNWDIGGINLTSITAYRDWEAVRDQDIDFASYDRAYRDDLEIGIETMSQEIRLQGEWGRVNWLVGAYAAREDLETTDRIRFGDDALDVANGATFFLTAGLGGPAAAKKLYDVPVVVPGSGGLTDTTICALSGGLHPVCTNEDGTRTAALLGLDANANGDNDFNFYLPNVASGDGQQADNWAVETESLSLFTHNEISISDNLIFTLGARYSQETKDMTAALNSQNAACEELQTRTFTFDPPGLLPAGNYNLASIISLGSGGAADTPFALACNAVTNTLANGDWSDSREENEWSGVASLSYHVNDDLMIYGGYSRGYKAGGFNLDRSGFFGSANLAAHEGQFGAFGGGLGTNWNAYDFLTGLPQASAPLTTDSLEFEPEFTDAYELGFKSTILGGTTYLNANLFYQEIHDYQSNAFSGFNFFTLNVPELVSQGVEVELNSRLTDALTVSGGLLYNEAYYDSDADYQGDGVVDIASGTPLAQAPEWTVTGAVNYRQPVGNGLAFNVFVNGRWVSEYNTMTLNRNPVTDNDSFAIFDARISLGSEEGSWSVEAWARNLTDEFYYVGGFGAPERTLGANDVTPNGQFDEGNYLAYPNAPRMVGLTLRARY